MISIRQAFFLFCVLGTIAPESRLSLSRFRRWLRRWYSDQPATTPFQEPFPPLQPLPQPFMPPPLPPPPQPYYWAYTQNQQAPPAPGPQPVVAYPPSNLNPGNFRDDPIRSALWAGYYQDPCKKLNPYLPFEAQNRIQQECKNLLSLFMKLPVEEQHLCQYPSSPAQCREVVGRRSSRPNPIPYGPYAATNEYIIYECTFSAQYQIDPSKRVRRLPDEQRFDAIMTVCVSGINKLQNGPTTNRGLSPGRNRGLSPGRNRGLSPGRGRRGSTHAP